MEICINLLETASSLAELHLVRDITEKYSHLSEEEIDVMIYEYDEDGNSLYKEGVQDLFDDYYDLYYQFLEKLAIK